MFGDGSLTLREFAMREPLPLARIQDAVLEFLRHRDDAALFGAQAVNAYVDEPRMTQEVDILSPRAAELAEELRSHIAGTFHIAVRVRVVAEGKGFRVFQLREPKNRHLADVRQVEKLPPTRLVADIRVPTPEELIAQKVIALVRRRGQPKSDTDRRDIKVLLLGYPQLKDFGGPVHARLAAAGADENALDAWKLLTEESLSAESEDDEF
jgi:nucleotidyltransferase AbiEii toxin of type IV toxin-antitoxin system